VILIGLILVLAGLGLTVVTVVRSLRHPRGELLTATAQGRRLIVLAAVAALLAAIALSVIPVYASSTGNRSTLIDVNGAAVLLVLLLPVLLAASPLLGRGGAGQVVLAASCGTLLAVFCVLGGFSVGSYYLPAAMLLLAAAAVELRARRTA
jgi:hypothetical protein